MFGEQKASVTQDARLEHGSPCRGWTPWIPKRCRSGRTEGVDWDPFCSLAMPGAVGPKGRASSFLRLRRCGFLTTSPMLVACRPCYCIGCDLSAGSRFLRRENRKDAARHIVLGLRKSLLAWPSMNNTSAQPNYRFSFEVCQYGLKPGSAQLCASRRAFSLPASKMLDQHGHLQGTVGTGR